MGKTIVMLHGRHFKPPKADLKRFWEEAIKHGVEADFPEKRQALRQAKIELAYYGDISNEFLSRKYKKDPPDDLEDRQRALEKLKQIPRHQFTKTKYRQLPGYNPWMEGLADFAAGPLSFLRLSEPLIEKVAPDLKEYWADRGFGSSVRKVFTDLMVTVLKRNTDVCVISHSLGTMISFDVFWKLSHYGEYREENWNRPIDLWLTLGSPLADETVKRNLKGASEEAKYRYPKNVKSWKNVAAEDDYISHDQKVANDYKAMKRIGYVDSIVDRRIYNLAVRSGKSNPHHGAGYLIHPRVSEAIANWL